VSLALDAVRMVNENLLPEHKLSLLRPAHLYLEETIGGKILGGDLFRRLLLRSTRRKKNLQELTLFLASIMSVSLTFAWFSETFANVTSSVIIVLFGLCFTCFQVFDLHFKSFETFADF